MLREELQLLQEPGSYVGEVIKVGCYMCLSNKAVVLLNMSFVLTVHLL